MCAYKERGGGNNAEGYFWGHAWLRDTKYMEHASVGGSVWGHNPQNKLYALTGAISRIIASINCSPNVTSVTVFPIIMLL